MSRPLAPANEELLSYLTLGAQAARWGKPSLLALGAVPGPRGGRVDLDSATLAVADLGAMVAFLGDVLGLVPVGAPAHRAAGELWLGAPLPLLRLVEDPFGTPQDPREPGLFHLALRFPDRGSLATTVLRLFSLRPELHRGTADHGYASSFYLDDPEGNGWELTVDNPQAQWPWTPHGLEPMPRRFDPADWLQWHHPGPLGEPLGPVTLGHVHLRTGALGTSRDWYRALGLGTTLSMATVTFLANAGEHQVVSLNTWDSIGTHRSPGSLGLVGLGFTVGVPDMVNTAVLGGVAVSEGWEAESPEGIQTTLHWG